MHNDQHFLTIEDGQLVDYITDDAPVVVDDAALDALMREGAAILCSSSIDHPREYTTDLDVLRRVARLSR